jgi:hypothetical protein
MPFKIFLPTKGHCVLSDQTVARVRVTNGNRPSSNKAKKKEKEARKERKRKSDAKKYLCTPYFSNTQA